MYIAFIVVSRNFSFLIFFSTSEQIPRDDDDDGDESLNVDVDMNMDDLLSEIK